MFSIVLILLQNYNNKVRLLVPKNAIGSFAPLVNLQLIEIEMYKSIFLVYLFLWIGIQYQYYSMELTLYG